MQALDRIKSLGFSGRHGHPCLYDVISEAVKLAKPLSFLEIGVYDGASLFTVLSECKPERIVLCDIFNQSFHTEQLWLDQQPGSPRHIRKLLNDINYHGDVSFLIEDSRSAIPKLRESFDMIHIDGNHETEYAMADFNNCYPLLNPGGYLVMDDTAFKELKPVCEMIERVMVPVLTLNDELSGSTLYHKPKA